MGSSTCRYAQNSTLILFCSLCREELFLEQWTLSSSCLLTLTLVLSKFDCTFQKSHSWNPTHPRNNSVIQTFPGAQIGSARPTTWPPRSQTFMSVYTKNHIYCIQLLGTLHILSAGIIKTVATTNTVHVQGYTRTPFETGECSGRHLIQCPSLHT